jgi:beta-glucosidase
MPWVEDVQAILEGYLGGQAGAGGVADILYGLVNPSGKLAETFPLRLEDHPSHAYFPGGPKTVEYRESLYVGYRFFKQWIKAVLFPFGHG